jgi:cobalamin biosynthesis Mg chelatase CobN
MDFLTNRDATEIIRAMLASVVPMQHELTPYLTEAAKACVAADRVLSGRAAEPADPAADHRVNVEIALAALRRAFPECPYLRSEGDEGLALLLLVLPDGTSEGGLFVVGSNREPPPPACQT